MYLGCHAHHKMLHFEGKKLSLQLPEFTIKIWILLCCIDTMRLQIFAGSALANAVKVIGKESKETGCKQSVFFMSICLSLLHGL